ncbi:MAG: hypothetical protein CMQ44_05215 [Gammaproteobacteria bacterium]|nr:hypothetical protein [Gammaproteobacteria bacterium]
MIAERGMALLLSLFVVVSLSTLALSAARQAQLTSVRVGHDLDVRLARIAARRAVMTQLAELQGLSVASFTPQGNEGLYRVEVYAAPPAWARAAAWHTGRCRSATRMLTQSAAPACTIVELLRVRSDPDYRAFRITARGVGARPQTTALIQAYAVLEL